VNQGSKLLHNLGETALHSAVRRGDVDTVALLLKYSADCNIACNKEGNTPLHVAIREKGDKMERLIELMLAGNADLRLTNKKSQNPLKVAQSLPGKRKTAVVGMLQSHDKAQREKTKTTGKSTHGTSNKGVYVCIPTVCMHVYVYNYVCACVCM
jgi:ankyrin repeat protein